MKNNNNRALKLKSSIDKLVEKRMNLYYKEQMLIDLIEQKRKKLKEICIHNDTKIENDYISGNYYERAQYVKREVCNICEKEINKNSTLGYYE